MACFAKYTFTMFHGNHDDTKIINRIEIETIHAKFNHVELLRRGHLHQINMTHFKLIDMILEEIGVVIVNA